MKAPDFEYHRPNTLKTALELLAEGEASALAGGQSLMPMMNFRIASPERLVDLNAVSELAGIGVTDGWLGIGAMTRYYVIENAPKIAEHAPLISRAIPHVAHPAVRNRGTIGGSCALADPAAEMPALLLALDAEISLQSQSETRRVPAKDFFLGLYETAREDNELVTAIHIPIPANDQRIGFHEITRRHGDYAMAGCAVAAAGDLSQVRIAFFGVSDRAILAVAAAEVLESTGGDEGALGAAIAALDEIDFAGDIHANEKTKQHLAGVALKRAWAEVMA